MSARYDILAGLQAAAGSAIGDETPEELLSAVISEVLTEAKQETVAWLVKKARESSTWDAGVLASKIDRGAVRIFLGTGHYRDAMDAHRAEVLAEAINAVCSEYLTTSIGDLEGAAHNRGVSDAIAAIGAITGHGKDTRPGTQPGTGESTQAAHRADLQAKVYDALVSFNTVARWAVLRRAQMRQYLAEHVAEELRKGASGGSQPVAAGFFQPDHIYVSDASMASLPGQKIAFLVEHITRHPEHGRLRAIGWSRVCEPGAPWHGDFRDDDEYAGWTDITEAGGPDA